jgi:hypothetical protein
VTFQITSQNTGNVHLSPYGVIEIKDVFGRVVEQKEVEPWFVMPKSIRLRETKWNSDFLIGKYTATLSLNRGYDNLVDQKTFDFWVIPWKVISTAVIGLILVLWFFIWLFSHLEFKRK